MYRDEPRDRHLPRLQADVLDVVAQVTREQLLADDVLLRERRGVDGLEPGQELFGRGEVALDRGLGDVGQLIVVAAVAEDGGELRTGPERVLPLLLEQIAQRLAALVQTGGAQFVGGGGGGDEDGGESDDDQLLHAQSVAAGSQPASGPASGPAKSRPLHMASPAEPGARCSASAAPGSAGRTPNGERTTRRRSSPRARGAPGS